MSDRHDFGLLPIQINPCINLHETGSKNKLGPVPVIVGAGTTRMSLDRFELGPVRNFLHEHTKSLQTINWCDKRDKHCYWELIKTRNSARNICKNVALVSCQSYVNASENHHFGSDVNLCRFHVDRVLISSISQSVCVFYSTSSNGRMNVCNI